jgi:hypothetical protein
MSQADLGLDNLLNVQHFGLYAIQLGLGSGKVRLDALEFLLDVLQVLQDFGQIDDRRADRGGSGDRCSGLSVGDSDGAGLGTSRSGASGSGGRVSGSGLRLGVVGLLNRDRGDNDSARSGGSGGRSGSVSLGSGRLRAGRFGGLGGGGRGVLQSGRLDDRSRNDGGRGSSLAGGLLGGFGLCGLGGTASHNARRSNARSGSRSGDRGSIGGKTSSSSSVGGNTSSFGSSSGSDRQGGRRRVDRVRQPKEIGRHFTSAATRRDFDNIESTDARYWHLVEEEPCTHLAVHFPSVQSAE